MPPHGHPGGHGHGPGHYHHGGGNYYYRGGGRDFYPEWGGGNEVYLPSCPAGYFPVLGTDGRVYDNECYCLAAGANVVRHLRPGEAENGFAGAADDPAKRWTTIAAVLLGGAAVIYGSAYLGRRRRKTPTLSGRRRGRGLGAALPIRNRTRFPEIIGIDSRVDGIAYQIKVADPKQRLGYDLVTVVVMNSGLRNIRSANNSRTTPTRASAIVTRYLAE